MTREVISRRLIAIGAVAIALGIMASSTSAQNSTTPKYTVHTLPLPDNGTGDVSMDYIAFDPTTNSLWVPGGNTAAVDVVDVATGKVRQIQNLPTAEVPARGGTRILGPSGVSIGDGVVYIGNRGGSEVCASCADPRASRVSASRLQARRRGLCRTDEGSVGDHTR